MIPVLVTGCAGFIGSHTCQALIDSGQRVVGIDNLNDYYDVGLKKHRLELLQRNESFSFSHLDIEQAESVFKLFENHQFESVINLAARAGVRYSIENPMIYMSTNAVGMLNILEAMKSVGSKRVVLASTSSLYAGQRLPFVETLAVNTPISPYAASKKAAEAMAYTYHHLYDFDVAILRYFTVYGPADRPDMAIHRFIQWIDKGVPITVFGDGSQSRDFTYVGDIAAGTILASEELNGFNVVNLGGGQQPISINTIIEKIEQRLNKKAVIQYKPFNKADMKTTWADIRRAEELLGWKPVTTVDEGIDQCVAWYQRNLPWSSEIELSN